MLENSTYIDILSLAQMLRICSSSEEVKEHILTHIEKLGHDGYKSIAVARIVNSQLEIIGLLPFIDELRSDSANMVDNFIDMGLSVIILTGDLRHLPSLSLYSYCIVYQLLFNYIHKCLYEFRKSNGIYKACMWKTWKPGLECIVC